MKNPLILTFDEKLQMLSDFGVDNVVLLDFKDYSHFKANDYLENVLYKYFSPVAITTGMSFLTSLCIEFNVASVIPFSGL